MVQLTVSISGPLAESRFLTLPVDVYASDGTIVARGIVSPDRAARLKLQLPPDHGLNHVHVLGRLPDGMTLQQTAELRGGKAEVALRLTDQSPHEWLQWVTPFRSLTHLLPSPVPEASSQRSTFVLPSNELGSTDVRRIGKVWMTLWALKDGRWEADPMQTVDRQRDSGMQQLVLDVPPRPHLLQVGGEEVAWRLVALPPGGPVRVALTRSATDEGDAIDITLGRARPDNELIMSYLALGAIAEADRLAEAWDAADLMLYEKKQDPVSAAAGAYLLLKNRRLQRRREWVDNLVHWFPQIADGAIVAASLALQRHNVKESHIRSNINLALERGLPIFAIGASILVETMAAIHRGKHETKRFHTAYLAAQAYARAQCSKGAYFAFYGKSPGEPSWAPIYGLEGEPVGGPTSAGSVEGVVYARPREGIQAGKFGRTRVSLPRASVSPQVVKQLSGGVLRINAKPSAEPTSTRQRTAPSDRLFQPTVDLSIQKVETNFLQEFMIGSERAIWPVANDARSLLQREKSQVKIVVGRPRKRTRRQTAKYWNEERLKNATTVFDGNE